MRKAEFSKQQLELWKTLTKRLETNLFKRTRKDVLFQEKGFSFENEIQYERRFHLDTGTVLTQVLVSISSKVIHIKLPSRKGRLVLVTEFEKDEDAVKTIANLCQTFTKVEDHFLLNNFKKLQEGIPKIFIIDFEKETIFPFDPDEILT